MRAQIESNAGPAIVQCAQDVLLIFKLSFCECELFNGVKSCEILQILWFNLNGMYYNCTMGSFRFLNWRKRQIGWDDGDLIQFQFDQVLFRRGGHFSPPKSTRWSRNSEILQTRYIAVDPQWSRIKKAVKKVNFC